MGRRLRWPGWHWLHSFFGLGVSLFLFFLFLTGTLSVFAPEIDWLIYPQMRADPGAGAEKLPWGAIYDAARAHLPAETGIVELGREAGPRFADAVIIRQPDGTESQLWIEPHTATVQGGTSFLTVYGIVTGLHKNLLVPGRIGTVLVAGFALPLTVAVLAGLMLYRRFWTGFFRWPRFGGRTRAWAGDLHRLIALWSLVFFIPLCLTGLWYLAEGLKLEAPPLPAHRIDPPRAAPLPAAFDGARLDQAVAQAQSALPGLAVSNIVLPRWPHEPVVIQGDLSATLVRPRANTVHLDPETLAVLGSYRGEALSAHQRLSEMADPIHYGIWGGLVTRILWAGFGLMLCTLAGLGIVIHVRRIAAMEEKRGVSRSDAARAWRDMGPFGLGAWGSVALIGLGLFMLARILV